MRNSGIALAIVFLAFALNGSAFGADAGRGRALYENHCMVCHTSKVHRREPRLAADSTQLFSIVERWQAEQNLRWSREEIDDVVYYLKVTQYNF
jgi:mono/diheme cytochrome c family protein